MTKTRIGVAIGRFQPITAPQFETVIVPAINQNDATLVILGSSFKPRTPLNPFTADERVKMIRESISELRTEKEYGFAAIRDYLYDETQWLCDVQAAVNAFVKSLGLDRKAVEVTLYGAALKGDKGFYGSFLSWNKSVMPLEGGELADLDVRNNIFEEVRTGEVSLDSWREEVPAPTISHIESWIAGEGAGHIVDEDTYIKNYVRATQTGKHAVIFQTTDAVVIYKGNILLIERGARPGRGQLALPGGFLKPELTLEQGALKELREECRFRVSTDWIKDNYRFSHPDRSLRGRTITECFRIDVPDWKDLPSVKGGSDARRAQWFELQDVLDNRIGDMFEDHLDIIETMIKRKGAR